MVSLTAGGHTFKRLRVDGAQLKDALTRLSEKNRSARFFLRRGCVLTEISADDVEATEQDLSGGPFVLIVDEEAR